jgi:hypothetical protein
MPSDEQDSLSNVAETSQRSVSSSLDVELGSEMGDSGLPVAYQVNSTLEGQSREPKIFGFPRCLGVYFFGFLIVIGAVLGGVCGTGHCSRDTSLPTVAAPTPSPGPTHESFNSTDELYQAIDIYLLHLTEDPENSIVARTYGYPIGTWDVSQIKNFKRAFAPNRNSTFDLLLPPSNFSTFNEDLSGWNVSAAETMFGLFQYCRLL